MEFEFTRASPYPPGAECCDSDCMSCESCNCDDCCCEEDGGKCCCKEECCKEGGKCCKEECCKEKEECCKEKEECCKEKEGCCSDDECECCSEDEVEEKILNLDFDMDVMDEFTKECGVSISSEDFLAYLVTMEFISFHSTLKIVS